MCMETVDKIRITDKLRDTITEDGMKVYKVVEIHEGNNITQYYPVYRQTHTPFREGTNAALITGITTAGKEHYLSGFHFWLRKKDAINNQRGMMANTVVIECIVKKAWVTSTGQNEMFFDVIERRTMKGKTIIAKKAIFPKFKK